MKIGVFDSGIGGLTVLKELKKYHPNQEYIYIGDNKNSYYGTKSKEELLELSSKIIEYFISCDVKFIFISCDSVCSNIYEELTKKYQIPIINIIDITANYINNKEIDKIAVISTPNTVNSHVFKNKLKVDEVLEVSCMKLESIIEGKIDSKFKKIYLEQYLKDIKKQGIKNIILGSSCYPLIEQDIKDILVDVNCYNMGAILASSIYLKPDKKDLKVYFTYYHDKLDNIVSKILEEKIEVREITL